MSMGDLDFRLGLRSSGLSSVAALVDVFWGAVAATAETHSGTAGGIFRGGVGVVFARIVDDSPRIDVLGR